jgi:hypothetical protein
MGWIDLTQGVELWWIVVNMFRNILAPYKLTKLRGLSPRPTERAPLVSEVSANFCG